MLGIDTNVLVRFVTRDEPRQAKRARATVVDAAERGERLFVNAIVLCELVWVLRSAYTESRERICEVLALLLSTPEFVIEDADLARRALRDYEAGGDFADPFIGHRNRRSSCEVTLTFDKRLARHALFRRL